MGRVGFKFPIFLTLIHYVTAWLLLAIFKSLSILPVAPPSRTTPFTSLFSLGAVMAFASGLANTSLKHNRFCELSFIFYKNGSDFTLPFSPSALLPLFMSLEKKRDKCRERKGSARISSLTKISLLETYNVLFPHLDLLPPVLASTRWLKLLSLLLLFSPSSFSSEKPFLLTR